ncbi:MAG: hypothetical protein ACRELY_00775 [Polyangiaceae bacterium]
MFKGSGSAFASSSADFPLPNVGATGTFRPFDLMAQESSSISDTDFVSYALMDIDGDARIDLVVTERQSDMSVGQSVWKVYNGSCK